MASSDLSLRLVSTFNIRCRCFILLSLSVCPYLLHMCAHCSHQRIRLICLATVPSMPLQPERKVNWVARHEKSDKTVCKRLGIALYPSIAKTVTTDKNRVAFRCQRLQCQMYKNVKILYCRALHPSPSEDLQTLTWVSAAPQQVITIPSLHKQTQEQTQRKHRGSYERCDHV